jgi:hypothetical protein
MMDGLARQLVAPHLDDMLTLNTVPVAESETEAQHPPARVAPRLLQYGERGEIRS